VTNRPWVHHAAIICATLFAGTLFPAAVLAADAPSPITSGQQTTVGPSPAVSKQVHITADRIEHSQITDVYEADGSVVIVQGTTKLMADHATLFALSGTVLANGHVTLTGRASVLNGDRLELNVNTEAGVVADGQLFIERSNSLFTGRLMQRFSEDHYRIKDGAFTNCDARKGEVPAWRFTFKDADLMSGDQVTTRDTWLCVNDIALFPVPDLSYPLATGRKSGLLSPSPGYDNRFGWNYRQSFYWALSPSQDLTISPQYWTDLGTGVDFEYRYALDRKSKGQWMVSALKQEKMPMVEGASSSDVKKTRALISGMHIQQINPDLKVNATAFLVSDAQYLSQLSNSATARAMPSGESSLFVNQRLANGNLYVLGQYLQPLSAGGKETFQRLPQVGHGFANYAPLGGPVLLSMDSQAVNFSREAGFQLSRVDLLPSLSTDMLNLGHVVGVTPQVRLRETYYTRGAETAKPVHRETLWAGVEGATRLSRRFDAEDGRSLLHTIEPKIVYEYVPPTDQSKIVQVDDVDDLGKKNLVTYSMQNRLLGQDARGMTRNWLNLTLAQSYRLGAVQTQARRFTFPGSSQFTSNTQATQPAMTAVQGKKFSDLWLRAVIGDPAPPPVTLPGQQQRSVLPPVSNTLTIDAFVNPYTGGVSQINADLRVQQSNQWYVEIGQRYTHAGNRVRRGDIWNPISFNEVFTPSPELLFTTFTAAVRLPHGWTVGTKIYYDFLYTASTTNTSSMLIPSKKTNSPETDVVALYQNPCKCWSAGFYYLRFPDRESYNFMISLTGIGWTENFGTAVVKSILSPLLIGERGLPWATPGGPYGRPLAPYPADAPGGAPRP